MSVFVIGQTGKRLDPTTERNARILVREGKAEVYQKHPYTIQLLYRSKDSTKYGKVSKWKKAKASILL